MNFERFFTERVNISALFLGIIMLVVLTQLSSLLPDKYYFGFSRFLFDPNVGSGEAGQDTGARANWVALIVKLCVPAVTGLVLGYFWRTEGVMAASLAGLAGALLMCWPAIVDWDSVAPQEVSDKRNLFLMLYALYVTSFAYIARTTSMIGVVVRDKVPLQVEHGGPIKIVWSDIVKSLVVAAASSFASYAFGHVFAG